MVGIPFDSSNSIWRENKYTGGVGDKERVGEVEGWEGEIEEMECYMERCVCMCVGGGGTDGKSWGEREKEVGSRDESKHPVPG